MDRALLRYDRNGDEHYDVISAFIKSMRGSDPDAALHYLARMIEAGEDPRFIARRLVVHAAEDVGLADPYALQVAVAAAEAAQLIGLPEARIPLAEATIYIATAPKSNATRGARLLPAHRARQRTGGARPAWQDTEDHPRGEVMSQNQRLRALLLEHQEQVRSRVAKLEADLDQLTRARRSESDDDEHDPEGGTPLGSMVDAGRTTPVSPYSCAGRRHCSTPSR